MTLRGLRKKLGPLAGLPGLSNPSQEGGVTPLGPTTATFTAGASPGSLIALITGLQDGETIVGVTPNDGRLAIAGGGTQVVVGLSASSAGNIAAVLTSSMGRVLNQAITVEPSAVKTPIMFTSRGSICGNGGGLVLAGSNGTHRDSNTVTTFYNELGVTVTEFYAVFETASRDNNGNIAWPNDVTISLGFEYPVGSARQDIVQGQVLAANGNHALVRFRPNVGISPGTACKTHSFSQVPEGGRWPQNYVISSALGEAADFNTGINKSLTGTTVDGSSGVTGTRTAGYGPTALVATDWLDDGVRRERAFAGSGDSRASGGIPFLDALGNRGSFGRGINGVFPYLNAAIFSAAISNNITSMDRLFDLFHKCGITDDYTMFGTNDLTSGRTASQIIPDYETLAARHVAEGIRQWPSTIDPRCTSTDDFLTTENMTANGASYLGGVNSERHKCNLWIRANAPAGRLVDSAAETETFPGSGVLHSATTRGGTAHFRAPKPFTINSASTTTSFYTDLPVQSPTNLYSVGNGRIYFDAPSAAYSANGTQILAGPVVTSGLITADVKAGSVAPPAAPSIDDTGILIDDNPIMRDNVHLSAGADGSPYSGQRMVADNVVRPLLTALLAA